MGEGAKRETRSSAPTTALGLETDVMASSPDSVTTRISAEHGQVDATSASALKAAGNDAVRAGDWSRACHMYTLSIDMVLGGTTPADAKDWYTLDVQSKGILHLLCSNRSLAYLIACTSETSGC